MVSVAAKCRICNNTSPAEQFKLSHEYKQMVCHNCFTGKTKNLQEREKVKRMETPIKPPGWDAEDEYLAKVAKQKSMENKSYFKKIPGSDHVKCTCQNCKFEFKYDPLKNIPRACPYCNGEIPRLRMFTWS
ncbi:MAG: hypothetical protein KKA62_02685 [Nanoarchaeota archaeon]|nr:hypothetical protein [Nanoarchaeota archaeon]MBU1644544.1 hypothetical protein [Nanoarchaeota archaeon]MBU1976837.1 hypothetical protein [Nanoarchaeota archaeon]